MYLCANLCFVPKFNIVYAWFVKVCIVGKLSIMPEFRTRSCLLKLLIMLKVTSFLMKVPLVGEQHCSPCSSVSFHCSRRMKYSKLTKESVGRWISCNESLLRLEIAHPPFWCLYWRIYGHRPEICERWQKVVVAANSNPCVRENLVSAIA
jgi:hypothetical protein